jgi:hypothetical protein
MSDDPTDGSTITPPRPDAVWADRHGGVGQRVDLHRIGDAHVRLLRALERMRVKRMLRRGRTPDSGPYVLRLPAESANAWHHLGGFSELKPRRRSVWRVLMVHDWPCARRSASLRMPSSEFATVRSHDGATSAPHQAPSAHRSVPSSPRYSNAVPLALARSS